jgi:hypothetical protein
MFRTTAAAPAVITLKLQREQLLMFPFIGQHVAALMCSADRLMQHMCNVVYNTCDTQDNELVLHVSDHIAC